MNNTKFYPCSAVKNHNLPIQTGSRNGYSPSFGGNAHSTEQPALSLHKNNIMPPSPKDCADRLSDILTSSGREVSEQDKKDFLLIFDKNKNSARVLNKVAKARKGGFSTNGIKEILWVSSKNCENYLDELLESDLPARKIAQTLSFINNSDYKGSCIKELKSQYGLDFAIGLLNGSFFISDLNVSLEYDRINEILFGQKPRDIQKTEDEFFKKHNVKLHLDYNLSPGDIDFVENSMKILESSSRKMPENIYITNFLKSGALGAYSPRNKNSLFVLPVENSNSLGAHALLHEFVHMNDITSKKSSIRRGKLPDNVKNLSEKFVSKYSLTNNDEFVAELGSLMLQGKIKLDLDGNILYKTEYLNHDNIKVSPTKDEINELMKYYFSIGGQIFESPLVEPDATYVKFPVKM